MAITGLVRFNVNCSDYERSRRFYEAIGFREVWPVPETTARMPESSGMRLRFVCFRDPDGTVLELVENG